MSESGEKGLCVNGMWSVSVISINLGRFHVYLGSAHIRKKHHLSHLKSLKNSSNFQWRFSSGVSEGMPFGLSSHLPLHFSQQFSPSPSLQSRLTVALFSQFFPLPWHTWLTLLPLPRHTWLTLLPAAEESRVLYSRFSPIRKIYTTRLKKDQEKDNIISS